VVFVPAPWSGAQAAARLFYRHGIHATGIAALTDAADVPTRTFYQHFPTKNALAEAYLHRYETEAPVPAEPRRPSPGRAAAGHLRPAGVRHQPKAQSLTSGPPHPMCELRG
jgi:AcrR family transcriptional regulator